ncbi:peptidylprolyl isomerase [Alisedimentitalea sp. MJ-SS2]|uniref:peptidylprolyl isomerase n=1 Tax=Aliisedimentitalea sp. MJ-SS2 TaxID=3049795 RepID=UPI00290E98E7|nr:peptidylprolyl isomerase [Alisedimentitalea sp. MJ-SS2]MDU8926560.1 peptidylprolyl isomerase [Alisedimentitalea sp. MJ-SS2]
MTRIARFFFSLMTAATLTLAGLTPDMATAQNLFAPAVKVNDKVITHYELQQRARMLQLFRAPGNANEEARKQLIEERLKLDAAEAHGLEVGAEDLEAGMEEFAGRANMTNDQFVKALESAGVARETYRDFIHSGVAWRHLVRAKFGPRIQVGKADVERALASNAASGVRVLISEIYIPVKPGQEDRAEARANEISQITTISAFARAARNYSAAPTRGRGGKVNWMPINKLPPAIQGQILGLAPGQVTKPIPISGAIALFQLRAIEEGKAPAPEYSAIEYAAYYIDGGRTPQALATAKKTRDRIDTCDDLYGIAKGQPEEVLERGAKKPGEIPQDIALELAKLDKHEVSTNLTRAGGQTLVFLMLCGRTPKIAEELEPGQIELSLQNRRLQSFADGYLEQLRSEARIIEK